MNPNNTPWGNFRSDTWFFIGKGGTNEENNIAGL
jgi:hypothetical protein